uniref:Kinetochore protein SPC25 n=1 Tax=Bicosoecida sp. CB-2014 TaxID=1486930 RepID=A0A7S1G7N0_9STRA
MERAAVTEAAAYGQAKTEFDADALALAKEAADMTEKAERVAADVAEEERQTSAVQDELDLLKLDRDALPTEIEALHTATEAAEAERELVEKSVASKRAEATYAVDELTKGVAFYKRLGLDFDGLGEDVLRLTFTQIDPAAPDREFTFTVNVTDDNVYVVRDVSPPVAGVEEMCEELNETNDFSFFVRRMRREFCALVAR